MERPNVSDEKYKLSNDFECIKFDLNGYQADINKHIDQVEAEKKELIEGIKKAINTLPCEKALLSLYPDSEENEALIKAIDQLNILIN